MHSCVCLARDASVAVMHRALIYVLLPACFAWHVAHVRSSACRTWGACFAWHVAHICTVGVTHLGSMDAAEVDDALAVDEQPDVVVADHRQCHARRIRRRQLALLA